MSYPRKIRTLIVEDDQQAKDNYGEIFAILGRTIDLAPPCFVRSYNDAVRELAGTAAYHLMILDLGLPYETRSPAIEGIDPGLSLVRLAAGRESFPIPALLVISGRLGQARLGDLQVQLQRGFWFGRFVNKGVDEDEAIRDAIRAIHRYGDIGVHVADGGPGTFPTISPREEDLLRRCVLAQEHCLGLQLTWWGADRMRPSAGTSDAGWTKVLMGNFLLDDEMGLSRPTFFKLEPAANAPYVHKDAALMLHKLSHVKVCATHVSNTRSLLVTQKVGDSERPPITLREYLQRDPAEVFPQLPKVVADIISQLARLGEARPDQVPINSLLWPCHDLNNIANMCERYVGRQEAERLGPEANPVSLYQELLENTSPIWVQRQTATHGDLNTSNIALDATENRVSAYIFDAAGTGPGVNVRDLAYLEITTLLHHALAGRESLVGFCSSLYAPGGTVPGDEEIPEGMPLARNVMKMVAEIRRMAFEAADQSIYALMVYDSALIQLGGLGYTVSGNKIENPVLAGLLASYTTRWVRQILPLPAGRERPGTRL